MPSIRALSIHCPVPQKAEGPSRRGKLPPNSVTSTIGEIMERLIANRLSWRLEEHSALSTWQAGFRKGRSATDQCLRLSQFISDRFQPTQRQHTIATFFDFSRLNDRVWHTGLADWRTPSFQSGYPFGL